MRNAGLLCHKRITLQTAIRMACGLLHCSGVSQRMSAFFVRRNKGCTHNPCAQLFAIQHAKEHGAALAETNPSLLPYGQHIVLIQACWRTTPLILLAKGITSQKTVKEPPLVLLAALLGQGPLRLLPLPLPLFLPIVTITIFLILLITFLFSHRFRN